MPRSKPKQPHRPIPSNLTIRQQAENRIGEKSHELLENLSEISLEQTQLLLYELRAHQIELEMQNDELRRVQAQLEESQNRYFDLFDMAPIGYLVLNAHQVILEANLTMTGMLAVKREQLIEKPLEHFIFSADQDIYHHFSKRLSTHFSDVNQPALGCELRLKREGGAPFWTSLQVIQVQDSATDITFRVAISDINESHLAADQLRESVENYENILTNAPIGFFQSYLDSGYRSVNPRMAQIFGFASPEDMLNNITDITKQIYATPSPRQTFRHEIAEHGRVVDFITQHVRKDGNPFWTSTNARAITNEQGQVLYYEGFIQDIDRRVKAEQRLHESETSLKLSEQIAHVGHWTWNTITNHVVWSDEMCRIFGLDPVTFDGDLEKIFAQTIHPDDREKVNQFNQSATLEEKLEPIEYRIIRPDRTVRMVRVEVQGKANDTNGKIIQLTGIVQDITEHKQAENALRESQQFLKAITDHLPGMVGYWTKDLHCGFANQAYLEWFGRTPEQMQNISMTELLGEELFQRNEPYIRAALQGKVQQFERTLIKTNGETGYTWAQYIPYRVDGEVQGFIATVTDITQIKRDQERLRISEEKWRSLFAILPVGISLLDAERHLVDYNPVLGNIMGLTADQIHQGAYTHRAYLHPDGSPMPPEEFPSVRAVQEQTIIQAVQIGVVKEDNQCIWVEMSAAPLNLPGLACVVVTIDITQRKQIEETLRRSEANLREAHRIARMARWELKLPGENREWSEGVYSLLELDPGIAPSNEAFRKLIHPEDLAKMDDAYNRAIQNKTPFQMIHRLMMPDGRIKWVNDICHIDYDLQGNLTRIIGIFYDITELKQVEEQSRLQSAALEAVANGVMVTNRDDVIQWVNPAFAQMTGYSLAEVVGNTPRLLKSDEQTVDSYKEMWSIITTGETWHGEITHRHKDGHLIMLEQFITPVRDEQNVVTHFVTSMTDISERIQVQQQLQLQSAALAAADNAIIITNTSGYIEWVNPSLTLLTGYSRDEAIGAHTRIFKSNTHSAAFYTDLWSTIRAGKVWRGQLVNRRKNGEHYHEEMTITPVFNAKNEIIQFIAIKQDISQRIKTEIELQQYADEQTALLMVTAASASQLDPADLLAVTLDAMLAIPHLSAECSWVLLLDDEQPDMQKRSVRLGMFRNAHKEFVDLNVKDNTRLCPCCIQSLEKPSAENRERQTRECVCITKQILEKEDLQSHIGIPLKVGEHLLGVLNLGWRSPYGYVESYYAMLNSIGKQLSLALQHARFYQKALQIDRLKIINQIGLEINASIDLDTVFHNMLNLTCRALHGQEGSILLIDPQSDDLVIRHTLTVSSRRLRGKGIKKWRGVAGWVVENKQSVLVNDVQHDSRWSSEFDHTSGFRTVSILCTPLIHNGNVIGVIEIINSQHGGFTKEDQSLLDAITPMAGVAIQNAQLFTSTRLRAEELDMINHIGSAIISSLDSDVIVRNALKRLQQQFAAAFVGLMHQDKTSGELVLKDAHFSDEKDDIKSLLHFKVDQNFLVMRAVQKREPILITDLMTDPETPESMRNLVNHRAHALMIMPMIVVDHVVGALIIGSDQVGCYNENDMLVLQSVASALSMALENARLYEDLIKLLTERERTHAQLIQSEKASALGRLAATVAHEINNPLQAIQGCLGLLGEEMQARKRPEKLNRYLEIVGSEIDRIAAIVQRMRDFYRPTNAIMQPTQLWQVVQTVLELSAKQLQHSLVDLEFVWDDKLPLVHANGDHLKQVFLNLIINAVDAMPQGGTLRVAIEKAVMTGENSQEIAALKVSFTDSGQGISAEELPHLYDPFFTTKPKGTGLGLYVSLNIIQAHGGKIETRSLLGSGTTFEIFIPTLRANNP